MAERGIQVEHSTFYRWVTRVSLLLKQDFRQSKRPVDQRWCIDETYIKIKEQWKYLYRVADTSCRTFNFLLTAKRDAAAALRLLSPISIRLTLLC